MLGMDKKSVANNNGRDNYNAESQYLIITSANIDIHALHIQNIDAIFTKQVFKDKI